MGSLKHSDDTYTSSHTRFCAATPTEGRAPLLTGKFRRVGASPGQASAAKRATPTVAVRSVLPSSTTIISWGTFLSSSSRWRCWTTCIIVVVCGDVAIRATTIALVEWCCCHVIYIVDNLPLLLMVMVEVR